MCNDDGGASSHQVLQCLLHQPLGLGIESGRCLIEDQDVRVLEHSARDAQSLSLTT